MKTLKVDIWVTLLTCFGMAAGRPGNETPKSMFLQTGLFNVRNSTSAFLVLTSQNVCCEKHPLSWDWKNWTERMSRCMPPKWVSTIGLGLILSFSRQLSIQWVFLLIHSGKGLEKVNAGAFSIHIVRNKAEISLFSRFVENVIHFPGV